MATAIRSELTVPREKAIQSIYRIISSRKTERREHEILKGHKYTFLKNAHNLSKSQKRAKYELLELLPTLGEACRLAEVFNDFWSFKDRETAESFLAFWCDSVDESEVQPFKTFVKTVKSHWSGIVNYIDSKISNGILEGINSKIQLAKSRAQGYHNIENFISMIYFIAGKLEFDYPQKTT